MGFSENISYPKLNSSQFNENCWIMIDPESPFYTFNSSDKIDMSPDELNIVPGFALVLLGLTGVILNYLLIVAIFIRSDFNKEYLALSVVSLAVTDYLFSIMILSSTAMNYFAKDMSRSEYCHVYAFIFSFSVRCSALHVFGMSGIRCFAVYWPAETNNDNFRHVCKLIPILSWATATLTLIPTLIGQYGQIGVACKSSYCLILDIDLAGKQINFGPRKLQTMIYIFLGISVSILNVATYFQVSRKTKKIVRRISIISIDAAYKILEKEKNVGKTVAMLTAAFLAAYYPYAIFVELIPNAHSTHPKVHNALLFLVSSIVVINPLVYMTCQIKCRKDIKTILRSICGFPRNVKRQTSTTYSTRLKF